MSAYQQPEDEVLRMVRDVVSAAEGKSTHTKLSEHYKSLMVTLNDMLGMLKD